MAELNNISQSPWAYLGIHDETTPIEVCFKIRHTPEFTRGSLLYNAEKSRYELDSQTPIQGIAPGQYAVIYDIDHNICFGSGMIIKGY